jgi:hypothetical protein
VDQDDYKNIRIVALKTNKDPLMNKLFESGKVKPVIVTTWMRFLKHSGFLVKENIKEKW